MIATNIQWCVDDPEDLKRLPDKADIPFDIDEDDIADCLSDVYGFLVYGFDLEEEDDPLKKEYEQFKLQWMIDHGYTLQNLISELADILNEGFNIGGNAHNYLNEAFELFEDEIGFNGSLWPCRREWEQVDRIVQEERG